MRTFTPLGFCLTLLCLLSSNANATHIMGASVTWDHVGKDSFEVAVKVYRDCTGIPLRKPLLGVGCKNGSLSGADTTLLSYNQGKDVTPVCNKTATQCDNSGVSFGYGVEEHKVRYLVDLSNASSCCKVRFSYKPSGNRSNSITTGLSNRPYYVESWVDRCKAPTNNSPKFTRKPMILVCKGVEQVRNQGAFDQDTMTNGRPSDSLYHSLAKPLSRDGSPLSLDAPYSYDKPLRFRRFPKKNLPFPLGFHFDNQTGNLRFTPTKQQVSVLKVEVEEYRTINGQPQQIGKLGRDVQVFVKSCGSNSAPEIKGGGRTCSNTQTVRSVCEGSQLSASFCTQDSDAKDSVELGFFPVNLPGNPQFTVKNPGAQYPEGQLSWRAPSVGGSLNYYQFSLTAEDDNCPKATRATRNYRVKVKPRPGKPNYNIQSLGCGKFRIAASAQDADSLNINIDGKAYPQDTFTVDLEEPNKAYPVRLVSRRKGCKQIAYDTIRTGNIMTVDLGRDTTICRGSSLTVNADVVFNDGPVSYTWQDSVKNTAQRTFSNLRQDTVIWVKAQDDNCAETDKVTINVDTYTQGLDAISDTTICARGDTLIARNPYRAAQSQWSNGSTADTLTITDTGSYALTVTNQNGCSGKDSFQVTQRLSRDLVPDSAPYCPGDSVTLKAEAGNAAASYQWINNAAGRTLTVASVASYSVQASLGNRCQTRDTIRVTKAQVPRTGLGSDTSICQTDSVQLTADPGYAAYLWTTGDTTRKTRVSTQSAYAVTVTNARGCTNTDTVQVTTLNDCVWPGDANNDGVANNQDILDIGVKYNTTGKTRSNRGTQWDAYKSNDWTDTFNSGLNTKFADCDGDGTVQASDTVAVSQNYGQTHNKRGLEGRKKAGEAPLSITVDQQDLEPKEQATVLINIGSNDNPVDNLYGIAANLTFDQGLVKTNGIRIEGRSSMLQAGATNLITFGKALNQGSRLEMALTRTDQQPVNGQGTAAKVILPLKADTEGDTLAVSLAGEYLVDPQGEPVEYTVANSSAKQAIKDPTGRTASSALAEQVQVYPNPTSGQLHVKVEQIEPEQARLLNARGQTMRSFDLTKGSNRLSLDRLPAGPYHLMIRTAEGLVQHTVVVR